MDKGIYCLVFRNPACTVRIGALGDRAFQPGWHIYVGSALGSGGLKRLERHISLAAGSNRRPRWHVDYLLQDRHFSLSYAVSAPTTSRLECRFAKELAGAEIPGFGCSDCTCQSHLLYRARDPGGEILAACQALGLSPTIKTIMSWETKR